MNTIIIEPSSQADYQLFIDLAKRLKAKFRISASEIDTTDRVSDEKAFYALAGSLDLPETSDELIKIIEESRTNKDIDTSWAE